MFVSLNSFKALNLLLPAVLCISDCHIKASHSHTVSEFPIDFLKHFYLLSTMRLYFRSFYKSPIITHNASVLPVIWLYAFTHYPQCVCCPSCFTKAFCMQAEVNIFNIRPLICQGTDGFPRTFLSSRWLLAEKLPYSGNLFPDFGCLNTELLTISHVFNSFPKTKRKKCPAQTRSP